MVGEKIRVRGLVQGVGFRPTVWRLAGENGLVGDVCNDGEGVLIRAWARTAALDVFCRDLQEQCPPLARIDSIERTRFDSDPAAKDFRIIASDVGQVHTGVVPDAATCEACRQEVFDPTNRRYRYPFTNCTHCGPRLSIIRGIPYDRSNTSMSVFPMCPACDDEYRNPADRRFHAQPNACGVCGPQVWLEDGHGNRLDAHAVGALDAVDAASRLLADGVILALKGIGGFHLACDAANGQAVSELRRRKRRYRKPFALMAKSIDVIRRYARVAGEEQALLESAASPIVLLDADGETLPDDVAPGQDTLGFMLPYSPLHHLLLESWGRPLVMTSGNLSEEPQCIDNIDARRCLGDLADYYLFHDRVIENRVDDSVLRLMDGAPRLLRRARGYAPTPIPLPDGFADAPRILALGGELKNALCLLKDGQAILSQHLGDLQEVNTVLEFERTVELYADLFDHRCDILATDRHPDYRSSRFGRDMAGRTGVPLQSVQHHFAHIAAVMADSGWPLDGGKVLGIALDGLGYGEDGTIWGGEFLLADYAGFERLAHLKPMPMPGGNKASIEPWRNAYAHLAGSLGWAVVKRRYADLDFTRMLAQKPLDTLDTMIAKGFNTPLTSSCGRLFDAVAAVLGLCPERQSYEGEAAIELEALARQAGDERGGYSFCVGSENHLPVLDAAGIWPHLMADLSSGVSRSRIAARFHNGLADAVVGLAAELCRDRKSDTVALSGGVFQNKTLFESIATGMRRAGLTVLAHERVPANDGGIALGQAVAAAAGKLKRI